MVTRVFVYRSSALPRKYLLSVEVLDRTWAWVSFNPLPYFTSLISSLAEVRSAPSQTFPRLTTSLGARWATPSHLGGFTFKNNKCHTNAWWSPQVLNDGNGSLFSISQSFTLSTQLTIFLKGPHKQGVGRTLMASMDAFLLWERATYEEGGGGGIKWPPPKKTSHLRARRTIPAEPVLIPGEQSTFFGRAFRGLVEPRFIQSPFSVELSEARWSQFGEYNTSLKRP